MTRPKRLLVLLITIAGAGLAFFCCQGAGGGPGNDLDAKGKDSKMVATKVLVADQSKVTPAKLNLVNANPTSQYTYEQYSADYEKETGRKLRDNLKEHLGSDCTEARLDELEARLRYEFNDPTARLKRLTQACKSNERNIATALEVYNVDNAGKYPSSFQSLIKEKYLVAVPTCPSAGKDTYTESYQVSDSPPAFTFYCSGHNHGDLLSGYPLYQSQLGMMESP